ncbi:uroporphyrin-III C-methyltransferase [Defluviimonas sp. 20V17]|uniref:Uncharacterized conserved protein YeaO, DUF488 family n=1 Tax=Allgaiera indica TaxID=765699 RepID=A0AAN4UU42_9RHOB|nr:DUF488 family protein [Allgaiera indica]KDB01661.1 uroporphyrin-III C-methyltransferase [Defluviimonas sp. 20V17]GHE03916.1 hypothetical protein GCM10008024_29020 [Allgaiera indica]SDX35721.1 Uncharacterized conserved protein YeaO, DUF488 family [Allgaiera indica]
MTDIRIKRAYRAARVSDGQRILVDRLWPRGLARDRARLSAWMKDLAPSDALRRWFNHDPAKWPEFQRRYGAELDLQPEALGALLARVEEGPVTLIYGARNEQFNNAKALQGYLLRRIAAFD